MKNKLIPFFLFFFLGGIFVSLNAMFPGADPKKNIGERENTLAAKHNTEEVEQNNNAIGADSMILEEPLPSSSASLPASFYELVRIRKTLNDATEKNNNSVGKTELEKQQEDHLSVIDDAIALSKQHISNLDCAVELRKVACQIFSTILLRQVCLAREQRKNSTTGVVNHAREDDAYLLRKAEVYIQQGIEEGDAFTREKYDKEMKQRGNK
jgi:hypothetical protein